MKSREELETIYCNALVTKRAFLILADYYFSEKYPNKGFDLNKWGIYKRRFISGEMKQKALSTTLKKLGHKSIVDICK